MKARAYLIPAALVLAGIAVALCTRFSYRDIGTEYLDYTYWADNDANFLNNEDYGTQGIDTARDLLARCDAAVLCTFTGKRQMTDEAMYQDMKVLEVLKGSESLKGTVITLVNQLGLFFDSRNISALGTMPVFEGDTYLLLLQKLPFHEERRLDGGLETQYTLLFESGFGMYNLSVEKQEKAMDEDTLYSLKMKELEPFSFLTRQQEALDQYNGFRDELLAMLKEEGLEAYLSDKQ